MGLFTNNKKTCPVCGSPTPRILPTCVEGKPICKQCAQKIDLPDGVLDRMSLADFKQYLQFYDANQSLRSLFQENYRFTFGFISGSLLLDTSHGLFRLRDDDTALVMDAPNLRSFRILEDNTPLFEGTRTALRCHKSEVPAKASALAPQINQYILQMQEYERWEELYRLHNQAGSARSGRAAPPPTHTQPSFEVPVPFRQFVVELQFSHPYWGSMLWRMDGPAFQQTRPSIDDYLSDYQQRADDLYTLAKNLMLVLAPDAPEQQDGSPQAAASAPASSDTVQQLCQYKELLDAGVLTAEEFAAKKRQLLGI